MVAELIVMREMRDGQAKMCASRESNAGPMRGRHRFYH
jgi:hypothetical protein